MVLKSMTRPYDLVTFIRFVFFEIKYVLINNLVKNSYSQCEEDIKIDAMFGSKKTGFYVDVGANDPHRFNNTARLHKKGWWGLNIDPNPLKCRNLVLARPKDITLNVGIGRHEKPMEFYVMNVSGLSTFSPETAHMSESKGFKILKKFKVSVKSLRKVFFENNVREIDFMSVDTEGYDYEVLASNDWQKYRPKIICVEIYVNGESSTKNFASEQDPLQLLKEQGYEEVFRSELNAVFKDSRK